MSNILIIKHGSLGDIAQASGAIQDINESHKEDQIYLLTTNQYVDLFKKFSISRTLSILIFSPTASFSSNEKFGCILLHKSLKLLLSGLIAKLLTEYLFFSL